MDGGSSNHADPAVTVRPPVGVKSQAQGEGAARGRGLR
jgi:hypothetical protein